MCRVAHLWCACCSFPCAYLFDVMCFCCACPSFTQQEEREHRRDFEGRRSTLDKVGELVAVPVNMNISEFLFGTCGECLHWSVRGVRISLCAGCARCGFECACKAGVGPPLSAQHSPAVTTRACAPNFRCLGRRSTLCTWSWPWRKGPRPCHICSLHAHALLTAHPDAHDSQALPTQTHTYTRTHTTR